LATPFVTVSAISSGEQGLLGIAFDPDYAVNRYVYVYYTSAQLVQNVVSRFTASATNPDVAQPGSELVLLQIPTNGNHVGGGIHFGLDRKLYIGVGDVGNSMNAQSLGTLAGKFLRIDPSTFPNIIPPNNPFVGTPGARGEIWALGLRNPFTSAVDPLTGTIYINDVGQNTWEEINRARSGGNYGWPICEGPCSLERYLNPVYAYSHPGMSAAITGGAFYRASQFPPAYAGAYFFSDYILGFIRALRSEGGVINFATNANSPVDLKVGPNGQLYYLSINDGAVYTIRFGD
jgi:glucose/arabinose dehydrogenase